MSSLALVAMTLPFGLNDEAFDELEDAGVDRLVGVRLVVWCRPSMDGDGTNRFFLNVVYGNNVKLTVFNDAGYRVSSSSASRVASASAVALSLSRALAIARRSDPFDAFLSPTRC